MAREALDYLFCTGEFVDRNPVELPAVILLDLNLPKVGALEVLRRIRDDAATSDPVVILASSDEQEDRLNWYELGATVTCASPWNSISSPVRCNNWDYVGSFERTRGIKNGTSLKHET